MITLGQSAIKQVILKITSILYKYPSQIIILFSILSILDSSLSSLHRRNNLFW